MKTTTVTVVHPTGLHARPASVLVRTVHQFRSQIFLRKGALQVNARSILGILMLGAALNTELEIQASGEDEEEAVQAVQAFFSSPNQIADGSHVSKPPGQA